MVNPLTFFLSKIINATVEVLKNHKQLPRCRLQSPSSENAMVFELLAQMQDISRRKQKDLKDY